MIAPSKCWARSPSDCSLRLASIERAYVQKGMMHTLSHRHHLQPLLETLVLVLEEERVYLISGVNCRTRE